MGEGRSGTFRAGPSRYTGVKRSPGRGLSMTITRVKLENFTVFKSLDLEPSPGINVLVGANGTGKTHLMKVCYAALASGDDPPSNFYYKLRSGFLPHNRSLSRLIGRDDPDKTARLDIFRGDSFVRGDLRKPIGGVTLLTGAQASDDWNFSPWCATYIPTKDMLANAPGFRSLYAAREVHFEETYLDILDRAFLPALRNPAEFVPANVLARLGDKLGGKVTIRGEEFFLDYGQGEIEFTLLAEGLRKLGLLWLLIRNGSLRPGAVLFWDEPETNLNPKLYGVVIDVLLELQRVGVQVFLATHDYVILKELDLQAKEGDKVAFHSLYRSEETGEIECQTVRHYSQIHPNAIADTFSNLYDREIRRSLAGPV